MFPNRIDLGVGRALGTNSLTVKAIRGTDVQSQELKDEVITLQDYLSDNGEQPVRSIPETHQIPIWIIGSGLYGAELASSLGLPYAFATHFAPFYLKQAVEYYKKNFKQSAFLDKPYIMVGVNIFAADIHDEAEYLASSHSQWVVNRNSSKSGLLPKPIENYINTLIPEQRDAMEVELACTAIGTKDEVGTWLRSFLNFTDAAESMQDLLN